jgi:hypothetical protein
LIIGLIGVISFAFSIGWDSYHGEGREAEGHGTATGRQQAGSCEAPSTYSAAVSWIHVTGPDASRLCRNGNAADFRPDAECLRPGGSVLGGSDVIAAEMKQAVDLIVG